MSAQARRTSMTTSTTKRKKKPRPGFIRRVLWPIIKYSTALVLALLVASSVGGKIIRPFQLCSRENRETKELAAEVKALQQENEDLRRKIKYLNTPRGVTQAARELGWVRPGEITLVIPEEEAKSNTAEKTPAPAAVTP